MNVPFRIDFWPLKTGSFSLQFSHLLQLYCLSRWKMINSQYRSILKSFHNRMVKKLFSECVFLKFFLAELLVKNLPSIFFIESLIHDKEIFKRPFGKKSNGKYWFYPPQTFLRIPRSWWYLFLKHIFCLKIVNQRCIFNDQFVIGKDYINNNVINKRI